MCYLSQHAWMVTVSLRSTGIVLVPSLFSANEAAALSQSQKERNTKEKANTIEIQMKKQTV
ncbi:hypothetical protein LINGRAHAP2_LOCUS21404 [Linum grandiflorum]